MRTKTMLVSALLGTIGSVAVMAQSNVYSLNVVGYVNAIIPPQWSILTCPLVCSPDNTLNTLLNNSGNAYWANKHTALAVYQWSPAAGGGYNVIETAVSGGWQNGGNDISIFGTNAVFVYNPLGSTLTTTWVGSVPMGSQTNTLQVGWNLVGSVIPVTGDLVTNSISTLGTGHRNDAVYLWDTINQGYSTIYSYTKSGVWSVNQSLPDVNPVTTNACEGFFYYNANYSSQGNELWVENFNL